MKKVIFGFRGIFCFNSGNMFCHLLNIRRRFGPGSRAVAAAGALLAWSALFLVYHCACCRLEGSCTCCDRNCTDRLLPPCHLSTCT